MCQSHKKFLVLLAPKRMNPYKHYLWYDELSDWVGMNAFFPMKCLIYKQYNSLFLYFF